MSLQTQLLATVTVARSMPWSDISTALQDPSNVEADALALEEIVGALPLPFLDAVAIELAIAGFSWLLQRAQAGGTRGDPEPIHDAQTDPGPQNYGRYVGR